MKKAGPAKPVERLFPFVLRSRILLVGRETLARSKRRLHFVLISGEVPEAKRAEILAEFAHYPVVQRFTAADLERHFGIRNANVVGFAKSHLAQSVYAELKPYRLNKPPGAAPGPTPELPTGGTPAPVDETPGDLPTQS